MAFKPDRDKLNGKFKGYKLAKEPLYFTSRALDSRVRVARLGAHDYSYQHVRAFTLCNHLTCDPWDGRSAYWCTEEGTILRGSYNVSGDIDISPVYKPAAGLVSANGCVNPSMVFLSLHLCLHANGCGSLQLLHTGSPSPLSPERGRGGEWRLIEELRLTELGENPFSVLAARYVEGEGGSGGKLDVVTMVLGSLHTPRSRDAASKPPVAHYYWHRVTLGSATATLIADTRSVSMATDTTDTDRKLGCDSTNIHLCCSLHSQTIPLYTALVGDRFLVISEAGLVPPQAPSEEKKVAEEQEKEEKLGEEKEVSADESKMETDEKEDEEKEERESGQHKGLGFKAVEPPSDSERKYKWSQTDSNVTVVVSLPDDVTKKDIECVIERREVVIGLSDGTTYVRGRLFGPVDPDSSTWTIENHTLEVSLEKFCAGQEWGSLLEQNRPGLPLRGILSDQLSDQELRQLEERIMGATKHQDDAPAAKRRHPLAQTTYEECDQTVEEDAAMYVFTENGHMSTKAVLGGGQFLFLGPPTPQAAPFFSLRHDIDAIIWQPLLPPTTSDSTAAWSHTGTFNALAYVQAAKSDRKFTACPPNLSFAAVCDCERHVFIYEQPVEGMAGTKSAQYVSTLSPGSSILGLQATDCGLVFVLRDGELTVIAVSIN